MDTQKGKNMKRQQVNPGTRVLQHCPCCWSGRAKWEKKNREQHGHPCGDTRPCCLKQCINTGTRVEEHGPCCYLCSLIWKCSCWRAHTGTRVNPHGPCWWARLRNFTFCCVDLPCSLRVFWTSCWEKKPSEAIRRLWREREGNFFDVREKNIALENIATTEDLKTARFKGINHWRSKSPNSL